jgi:leucyl-tRNA synthetase
MCGEPVERGRVEKMSKSKKNIVDPEHLINAYGADTARLFILFAAPPAKDLEWSDQGVEGASRFLARVWRLVENLKELFEGTLQNEGEFGKQSAPAASAIKAPAASAAASSRASSVAIDLRRLTHRTIKKVTEDIEREFQFNTAVAALMEFVNGLYKIGPITDMKAGDDLSAVREALETLLVLLSPFAPHIAEELWAETGHKDMLAMRRWPSFDQALIEAEIITIPIQINGKVRTRIDIGADWTKEQVKAATMASAVQGGWVRDASKIRNWVYVDKRIVNIVVES